MVAFTVATAVALSGIHLLTRSTPPDFTTSLSECENRSPCIGNSRTRKSAVGHSMQAFQWITDGHARYTWKCRSLHRSTGGVFAILCSMHAIILTTQQAEAALFQKASVTCNIVCVLNQELSAAAALLQKLLQNVTLRVYSTRN